MVSRKSVLTLALAAGMLLVGTAQPASLTPLDVIEIRQLAARYAYAVDSGADNGQVYAGLFAPDGAFLDRAGRATTGRENLAALARRNTRGRQSAFHFVMNHVIEPSAGGATGRLYLLQLRIGEAGRPNDIFGGGHYQDVYVKTPDGWRFERRQFLPSDLQNPPASPAVVPAAAAMSAPRPGTAGPRPGQGLTDLDYVEIEQLVYRYGWALDSGDDNGYAYADLYAPDGVFTGTNQGPGGRSYQGRESLAALARGGRRGPLFVSHYVTNVVIEPTAEGAVGRTYVAIFDIGNGGTRAASRIDHGGLYNDVYVRTPAGWKFKTRTYYESTSAEPVQPPPAMVGVPRALPGAAAAASSGPIARGRLAVQDYVDIQQLVSRYPYALDGNTDEGSSYANLFTPDGVFGRPGASGRETLMKIATAEPHGPRYVRHFITNHVIDPTETGATGKEYLVVVDIGENGMPSKVFLGGHYEDTYAKTADGWRFKARAFIPSATGSAPRP